MSCSKTAPAWPISGSDGPRGHARIVREPNEALLLARAGARTGVPKPKWPTATRPGVAYIRMTPVGTLSWDYSLNLPTLATPIVVGSGWCSGFSRSTVHRSRSTGAVDERGNMYRRRGTNDLVTTTSRAAIPPRATDLGGNKTRAIFPTMARVPTRDRGTGVPIVRATELGTVLGHRFGPRDVFHLTCTRMRRKPSIRLLPSLAGRSTYAQIHDLPSRGATSHEHQRQVPQVPDPFPCGCPAPAMCVSRGEYDEGRA